MKILFETYNTFAQNTGGGVQTKLYSLRDSLSSIGCEVDLFDKWKTKVEDYDIVHFFKVSIDDFALMNYAKSLGKKIVLSSIVPLSDVKKIIANRFLCKYLPIHTTYDLIRRSLVISNAIITESQTESNFINRYYGVDSSMITALPNGVSGQTLGGNPHIIRNELPFKEDFVLQVGRIDKNKNQLSAIRALKGTGIPLVIVGGPAPQEMGYYEQCRKEADDEVYFTGWIPMDDPRLSSCYAAAKVLILPSINEIYGNVIVEGALNNCLLACSNSVPISDWNVLKPYIHSFNPLSKEEIKHIVVKLYNGNTPSGQYELFNDFFSWERIAKKHFEIYERLLS